MATNRRSTFNYGWGTIFAGQGCDKVLKDFQGDDRAKVQRKKAAFYSQTGDCRDQHLTSGQS